MGQDENVNDVRKCKARVLVVENDPEVRESNATKLRYWDYEPVLALGTGQALLKDAVQKARAKRCQMAMVDLHLIDDHDQADWSGLELTRDLLPTLSIIHSGSVSYQTVREALSAETVLDFVGKSEGPEDLREVLDRCARGICACRHPVQIEWPPGLSSAEVARVMFPDDPAVPADEAADLLIRLFPKADALKLDYLGGHSPATPSLPRQRAIVLRAWEDGTQPVIVKLARAFKMEKEIENYRLYIRRRLAGSFIPMMEETSVLWDIGGAVYTLLGSSGDIIPLSKAFTDPANKIRHLTDSLEKFFNHTWLPHYEQKDVRQESSLVELYYAVWYGDWWLERLLEHSRAGRVESTLLGWPAWQSLGLPEPVQWLAQRVRSELQRTPASFNVAVTHGDLHSENLLVDAGSHNVWVIDFERTGVGHILQDFVELEGDLLVHLMAIPGEDLERLYRLFVCAAAPTRLRKLCRLEEADPQVARVMEMVRFLRQTAAERSGLVSSQEYLYGVLLNVLFRAMLLLNAGDSPAKLLPPLMLASILCCRLDHWEDTWPLPGWPPVPLKNRSK